MLLAIDTSTHYASVALHGGSQLLAEHTWLANQDHTRTLLPAIRTVLAAAHTTLDAVTSVAVALGPGSFNGLRVGLSTAKGLALARDLPLVGVPTLELLASEYGLSQATMNAGRGRVYRMRTDHQAPRAGLRAPRTDTEIPGVDIVLDDANIELVDGDAPDRVRHASVLAELGWRRLRSGQLLNPAKVQPIYVQPPHITPSRKVTVAAAHAVTTREMALR